MFVLETDVSYPPNAQMRLAASFVHFLRSIRTSATSAPCGCNQCNHAEPLREFWSQYRDVDWSSRRGSSPGHFSTLCSRISGFDVRWCDHCDGIMWTRLSHDVGQIVCSDCYPHYHYCDDCAIWYHDDDADDHNHAAYGQDDSGNAYSRCRAPNQSFKFPARCIDREIQNDERATITLPAGHISDEGLDSIFRYVYTETGEAGLYYALSDNSDAIGSQWTTREGNFPKRIAKLCLQNGVKLTPTLLTQIGNLARQHTSTQSEFHVEVTRDFSAGASAFVNGSSCWFSDYWQSLCMLKSSGGLALRTYRAPSKGLYDNVAQGRAWVIPFDTAFQPTHDTDAYAYVLFNVYGLSQYEAAHILAQMTGRSYRKIGFSMGRMYINSNLAFLVASPAACNDTSTLNLDYSRTCRCPYGS